MNNVSGVGGPAANSGMQQTSAASTEAATFQHSQLGSGSVKGADTSMFEEMAMNVAGLKDIKKKDNKKDKEALQKLLEASKSKVPDMPDAEKLDQCLQKLKDQLRSGNLNDEGIRDAIGEYSGDATHQYLGVEDLIAYLQGSESDEDKTLAAELRTYNDAFYEANKLDIQSGINVSGVAAEFAETKGSDDIGELRDSWRTTVKSALALPEFDGIAELFSFALQKAGGMEEVGEWLEWTTIALGHDLDDAQSGQYLDPVRMKYARSQLEGSFYVNTLFEQCNQIQTKIPGLIRDELHRG